MSIFEGDNPLDGSAILLLLLQLIIVVVLSRILTRILRYIKQPPVIAEILGGIILGPTVMGYVPGFTDNIFPEESMEVFYTFAEVGLIFFMFLIGMEVDPQLFKRKLGPSLIISLTAMSFTFVLSLGASAYIYYKVPSGASYVEAILFTGVATAITAFPVLARILADQNLMHSKVGVTALSVAAIDDVTGWIALALVVSIAKSSGSLTALYTLLALLGYVLVMLIVVRPITALLVRTSHRKKMQHEALVLVLMLLFASSWTTEAIGIHAIFGGFVMGIVVPRENQFHMKVTKSIEDLVTIVFLPLYFTYSGLRTKLEDLNTPEAGIMVILILAASNIGKIGGASVAARLVGHTCRESLTVGVLLNTKGLVELIVLNIGLDVGILTQEMFASFIVMALFNTFITTPLCYLLWTRWAVRTDPNLRPKDKFSVVMCVDEPASALAMVEVAAAVIHGQRKRKKLGRRPTLNALQLMEVSDAPSSYFFALRQKKSNALVFAKKHATLLGLNLRSTTRVSAHVSHDLTQQVNSWLYELVLLCWHPPHEGAELAQGRGILHHLLQHARAPVGALVYPGNFNAMNSVDNVLFVYRFERCEREALQLVLSLLANPQTRVTVVLPSRDSWERELHRRFAEDQEDEGRDYGYGYDGHHRAYVNDDVERHDGELDELMDLASDHDNDDDGDNDDGDADDSSGDDLAVQKQKQKQKQDEQGSGIEGETEHEDKHSSAGQSRRRYTVGDLFDILVLAKILRDALLWVVRTITRPCLGNGRRGRRGSLDDDRLAVDDEATATEMTDVSSTKRTKTKTKTTNKRTKTSSSSSASSLSSSLPDIAGLPAPEGRTNRQTDDDPGNGGASEAGGADDSDEDALLEDHHRHHMSSSRSSLGLARMAEQAEQAEERRQRLRGGRDDGNKSDHEGLMQQQQRRRGKRRQRAPGSGRGHQTGHHHHSHHPHLPWLGAARRRRDKAREEEEDDPERAWMGDMDEVLAVLNQHPGRVTILPAPLPRLLEAALREERRKRAQHQRQLLLLGVDREWDTFADRPRRWSAFIHAAATPSTFVLLLHPRLPGGGAQAPGGEDGSNQPKSLLSRLFCCCSRGGASPPPPLDEDPRHNDDALNSKIDSREDDVDDSEDRSGRSSSEIDRA